MVHPRAANVPQDPAFYHRPDRPDAWFDEFDWMTLRAESDATGRITGFVATAPWASGEMKAARLE